MNIAFALESLDGSQLAQLLELVQNLMGLRSVGLFDEGDCHAVIHIQGFPTLRKVGDESPDKWGLFVAELSAARANPH